MNTASHQTSDTNNWFQLFKYTVYFFLVVNLYLFFMEDYKASLQAYPDGVSLNNLIVAYAATIDTFSWIVLLATFELETWVIDDEQLTGATQWVLNLIKGVCYIFIIYSAWGYTSKFLFMLNHAEYAVDDVCQLINTSFTYVKEFNDYPVITQDICTAMNGETIYRINNTDIIATKTAIDEAVYLSAIDIVNSYTWLALVIILEIDVYLQLKGRLEGLVYKASNIIKVFLYLILFVCAVLWGIDGTFVDFWDAFLWLLAFFFIEMNIFQWHAETEAEHAKA